MVHKFSGNISWDMRLLFSKDINKLTKDDLKGAYKFAYHRANRNIENLRKFEQETGYRSSALDFIESPGGKRAGKGAFNLDVNKASLNELRREVGRIKYFLSLSTSNVGKTKKIINTQRKQIIKTLEDSGVKVDRKSLTAKQLSRFFELFRRAQEYFKGRMSEYDSTSVLQSIHEVVKKYGYNVKFEDIVDEIEENLKKNYEDKERERIKEDEEIRERAKISIDFGSSDLFSDISI